MYNHNGNQNQSYPHHFPYFPYPYYLYHPQLPNQIVTSTNPNHIMSSQQYLLPRKQNVQKTPKGTQTQNNLSSESQSSQEKNEIPSLNINLQSFNTNFNQLLQNFHINKKKYSQILADLTEDVPDFEKSFFQGIDRKISSFRKSKQEMIKILIRRTQRLYLLRNNKKKDPRFVKYGRHKSMNTHYMQELFSDIQFAKTFEIILERFQTSFEQQNQKKVAIFFQKMEQILSNQDTQKLLNFLNQKSRMPWPKCWRRKIYEVGNEILRENTKHDSNQQMASHSNV